MHFGEPSPAALGAAFSSAAWKSSKNTITPTTALLGSGCRTPVRSSSVPTAPAGAPTTFSGFHGTSPVPGAHARPSSPGAHARPPSPALMHVPRLPALTHVALATRAAQPIDETTTLAPAACALLALLVLSLDPLMPLLLSIVYVLYLCLD